ncbi:MAG: bifunctional diaminohydroxyphosphoribosylaminopyrimidine deaminase/5-amino-6-(5-phosphoribosylamino)uracil reductase RibD [Flavobacteriaceae bacterium]|nr:bifunctional diaminohydroxyphosphoribosylaminopyrimidine deaminase/5-amino-6-(5-phosphoribosylamino)uracil reductase RibD [Flavobacteriaceae bacterium]MBL6683927.1 bifunctional diaminohydroxyphosphoribosylaminopyrimidine deaminase/5-amino-6-(5-phosphoribosylamino)uracil reductase RibD [Flavobacteriaceae bacterium]
MNYELLMQRCVAIGNSVLGHTYPNPNVGALIFKDGKIISEGYTGRPGQNHAEINAIENINDKKYLENSTMVVTLEPCSHYGKTPPCTKKIIESKIKKVIIGCKDPNLLVNGSGIDQLINNNIDVKVGVLENECLELHKRFFTFQTKKRPYIILKWAETDDGIISPKHKNNYRPYWISNDVSRQYVHKWRSQEHAILVGSKTIDFDNPLLDSRNWDNNSPIKIVIGNPKIKSKDTLYIHNGNDLNIENITNFLHKNNIQSILVEGGYKTLKTFIENNLWDEARIFKSKNKLKKGVLAPKINGKNFYEQNIKNDKLKIIRNH